MTAFAPQIGEPPVLANVAIDLLATDPAYQREADDARSKGLIRRIAGSWDWRLYQPIICARRADGSIMIVDGQHRWLAAKLRADIAFLPAVVCSFDDPADEARAFDAMNFVRKPMSRVERYRAALIAGDEASVKASKCLAAAGMTVARHSNTGSWKPGWFGAIGSLVRQIEKVGEKPVESALCALAEAFPDEAFTQGGMLVDALVDFYRYPDEDFDPDLLIEVLGEKMQDEWREEARRQAVMVGGNVRIGDQLHLILSRRMTALAARRAA